MSEIAVTPDGRRAVSASYDGTAKVWEIESGRQLHALRTDRHLHALAVTPDGRLAVAGDAGGSVHVWELKTGRHVHVLTGHTAAVNRVAISPDGRRAISASDDCTVRVWDVDTGQKYPHARRPPRSRSRHRGHAGWAMPRLGQPP